MAILTVTFVQNGMKMCQTGFVISWFMSHSHVVRSMVLDHAISSFTCTTSASRAQCIPIVHVVL